MCYYQIHVLIQEDDAIYRHIPLYFGTTTDKALAVKFFESACMQIFEFEDMPKITEFDKPLVDGTIKQAIGNVTSSYNHKGKYLVELQQNAFKPQSLGIL